MISSASEKCACRSNRSAGAFFLSLRARSYGPVRIGGRAGVGMQSFEFGRMDVTNPIFALAALLNRTRSSIALKSLNGSVEPALLASRRPPGLLKDWDDIGTQFHSGAFAIGSAQHVGGEGRASGSVQPYSHAPRGLLELLDQEEDAATSGRVAMAPELRPRPAPDELLNLPPIWYPSPLDANESQIRILEDLLKDPAVDARTKDAVRAYIEDYQKRQDRLLEPGEGLDYERRFYQWHEDILPEEWEERRRQEEQRWKDRAVDRI